MDLKNKMPVLVFIILYVNQVSAGIKIPSPLNLEVDISDGEVTALWESPVGNHSDSVYNVQMGKYGIGEWVNVLSCTKTTKTYCQLSSLIHDYSHAYKVRVQMVKGDKTSPWVTKRKFLLNESKLLPPFFTLWATSSTLTIRVHKKPILKKLFPYGVTYTIYMEERGQENKTTIVYLKDDDEEAQRMKTFTALHWGREYCVSIREEANGALSSSRVSDQQCLFLPEQEYFIIAASSLSILGVFAAVAIMSSFLLCYLRRPAKTPTALKSPLSGWHPLSVSEGIMEVVTDKGWFLSSYSTEVRNSAKLPVSHTAVEDIEEETRRTSLDSGLSIEADSGTESVESPPARQEDSGCGSMGGSESSSDSTTDYPLQDERIDTDEDRKREDSGLDISLQLDSLSLNLEGQESEPLMKTVIVDHYRSQSPSDVQIESSDSLGMLQQIPTHSLLAEVVTGYRAGPQSCICSGVGQCSWCHKYGHFGSELIKQHRLLGSRSDLTNPYRGKHTFSAYSSETQMDTVTIKDLKTTFLQINETFPLLTALPLAKCEQDFNMNNLSLCDVQLMTD